MPVNNEAAELHLMDAYLKGNDKYLGLEVGSDGCIYGIPGSARYVLKITPETGEIKTIGPKLMFPLVTTSLKKNQFKWLRGILAGDGCVYGVPANADCVLKIYPSTATEEARVTTIGGPFKGIWKWHGAVLARDGNIYGIPCNADRILKITVATGEVIFHSSHLTLGTFPPCHDVIV
jgi:hypothetical protein